jgi:uncharacterized membrane protein YdbT with pleckstrin-like domain
MAEEKIWNGCPSQVLNLQAFLICLLVDICVIVLSFLFTFWLLLLLLLPLGYAFWCWLDLRCQRYELTTERIHISKGIFTLVRQELELYRVKDTTLVQPFFLRLFSLGNIHLVTSDRSDPEFTITAIKDPTALLDNIRKYVEIRRDQKRVKEVDME